MRVARDQRPAQTAVHRMAAPSRGLVTNESLANPAGLTARVVENWLPTERGLRVRGGASKFAFIGSGTDPVRSLMSYKTSAAAKIFATTDDAIYDISAVADVDVTPSAAVSSLTSGDWSSARMTTAGGNYLYIVNGSDQGYLYDGSTWAVNDDAGTPAITGVATANLSHVWVYRGRVYFIEGGTQNVWYLGLNAISGAATAFNVWGVFRRGGSILTGATWSLDASDGIDDKFVLITDQGEAAVYEGSNPGGADWALIGRYDIGFPLGKNAILKTAGDLFIATKAGLVSIGQVISRDPSQAELYAISQPIEEEWEAAVIERDSGWQMGMLESGTVAIVSLPSTTAAVAAKCFAFNTVTLAWAVLTGWDAWAVAEHDGSTYFGTRANRILKADNGGTDAGELYTAKLAYAPDYMGIGPAHRAVVLARGIFAAANAFNPQISFGGDYTPEFPAAPAAVPDSASADVWDTALWDTAVWAGGPRAAFVSKWIAPGVSGIAPLAQVQITIGSTLKPNIEFSGLEVVFDVGELVA